MKKFRNLARNRALRVQKHEREQRQHENNRENNRDAVKILFDDVRTGLSGIQRAGDHVGNAGALAGMQQHEHDKANTRNSPDDKDQNKQRIHVDVLLYRGQKIAT